MKKNILFLFMIISLQSFYPQSKKYNGSVICEASGLFAETQSEKIEYVMIDKQLKPKSSFEKREEYYSGFGVYYSGTWNFGKNYFFEIRPGIFSSQRLFSGAQFGLHLRKYFAEDYLVVIGVVSELHLGDGGHSYEPNMITGTMNFTFGRKLSDNILILLTYSKTLNDKYGKYFDSSTNKKTYGYLYSLLKLGIEIDI